MADLYSLMHREAGPLANVHDARGGGAELEAVLEDEPDWRPDLWVEPFVLVVAE